MYSYDFGNYMSKLNNIHMKMINYYMYKGKNAEIFPHSLSIIEKSHYSERV